MIISTLALSAMILAPSPHHRFGLTEAMPRIDGTVRIATYNMLNFFDEDASNHIPKLDARDGNTSWELSDITNEKGIQYPHTSKERRLELARVIKEIDADILLLQEIESKETLEEFNKNELAALDCEYKYVASEDVGYYRGVEQSILSRYPISDVKIWPDANLSKIERIGPGWSPIPATETDIKFQRSPLKAKVTIAANQQVDSTLSLKEDYEIEFFVVHHKAGGARTAWHRELEALQIMNYVREIERKNPLANIIVAGDFNAQSNYKSARVYLESDLHDAMKHRATSRDYDIDHPLWQTHSSSRAIDLFLFNGNAYDEFIFGSAFVLGTSAEDYDWRNTLPPPGIASDHFPVVVDIVPTENQGNSIKAPRWPSKLTKTALGNVLQGSSSTSQMNGTSDSVPVENAKYIANKNSRKLHYANCVNAKKTSAKNKVGFDSYQKAIDAGCTPAGCCKPK